MKLANRGRFEVAAVRAGHRIDVVVAASGVELTQRGQGFMGCCPFHDDSTASLSVGGVADRFHCFGCGAGGDVIEYVQRFTGLSFVNAVQALEHGAAFRGVPPAATRHGQRLARVTELTTTPERAHAINLLAWEFFTTPANIGAAETYLREARGIDVVDLCSTVGGEPIVGYANTDWRALTRHLLGQGVNDSEQLDLDLAQPSRHGELIDTYRGRLIIPVLGDRERINGFIGRDTTGDPRAPKYRNPTRTPVFDKSAALYRPTHHGLDRDANVVVVEGAIDALAIAAAAARTDELPMFAPATTSGVTVSPLQAHAVLVLHPRPPVIALDGDNAGREGTNRWLHGLCIERGRPALVTRLPDGVDPAEWLQHQGDSGLRVFDRRGCLDVNTDVNTPVTADAPRPALPGRELVRIRVDLPGETHRHVLDVLVPLAMRLPEAAARELIDQAERELTGRGWNPRGEFARAAHAAVSSSRRQVTEEHRDALAARERHPSYPQNHPALMRTKSPDPHHQLPGAVPRGPSHPAYRSTDRRRRSHDGPPQPRDPRDNLPGHSGASMRPHRRSRTPT